jgi:hypothetical protein
MMNGAGCYKQSIHSGIVRTSKVGFVLDDPGQTNGTQRIGKFTKVVAPEVTFSGTIRNNIKSRCFRGDPDSEAAEIMDGYRQ